jgi:hypothetical protein
MYLAELRGKLSSRVERMEDILTSNVFSFFKYSSKDIFLKNYLNKLGFNISNLEAEEAEFRFWPVFEDGTEPDLVIMVGKYYLLIEAKYFSGFGKKTETTDDQLKREIKGGQLDAFSYGKEFYLIAITADYYFKKYKFDKKHLRSFQNITYNGPLLKDYRSIFFDAKTAKLRGDFIGFIDSLSLAKGLKPVGKTVFFSSTKRIFKSLSKLEKLKKIKSPIFFKEDESNE